MPLTLSILYHSRKLLFTLWAFLMTLVIWLLLTDLIIRDPIGAFMLKHLSLWYGFWPMYEHGIRGSMAIYPETRQAHWIITLAGLGIFFITQVLFLEPGRKWRRHLVHRTPASTYVYVMAAFPAALLTVSLLTSVLEAAGLWRYIPGETYHALGCRWFPQAMMTWLTLLVAWSAWARIFETSFRKGDRYMQLAGMTYCLFVASAICLGVASVVQIHMVGFISSYWLSGSYTGIMLSSSVMLWTLIPALVLIYSGKTYSSQRIEIIRDGDMIGSHWFKLPRIATSSV